MNRRLAAAASVLGLLGVMWLIFAIDNNVGVDRKGQLVGCNKLIHRINQGDGTICAFVEGHLVLQVVGIDRGLPLD